MKLCYGCVFYLAASNGHSALGNACGRGRCDHCKAPAFLYDTKTLGPASAAETPMPVLRKPERAIPEGTVMFGWSVVLMAIALMVSVLLLARCANGATGSPQKRTSDVRQSRKPVETHEQWCQRTIRKLPVFYEDNPPAGIAGRTDEKERQLTLIAHEVAEVSKKPPGGWTSREWAAVLFTVGFHESSFSLRIHAGNCRKHECDGGRARSPWQLHRARALIPVWDDLFGVDKTAQQVRAADFMLRLNERTCDDNVMLRGLLTAYGGRPCGKDWPGLQERMATFARLQ